MIELPRLEPPELSAAATIFRRRPPLAVDTAAGRLTLEAVPEDGAGGDRPPAAVPFRLDLRLGEGRAALATESALAEALLETALPGIELAGLDPELRALAVELAAAPLAEAAEAALGRAVRVTEDPAPGAALPYRVHFRAGLAGREPWPVRLELDLRGLEAVVRAYERVPAEPAPLDDLVLPLAVEAGRTRLPVADLADAAPGDLLLLEDAPVARGRLDLVLGGVLAFACGLSETTLSYTGEARALVAGQSNVDVETLDEVPVELVFELGRLGVPLGELRSLAPGHVFDLGRDLRHPVDVLLAGRKIGEGELVQVGERVGVRLRSVVPR